MIYYVFDIKKTKKIDLLKNFIKIINIMMI